MHEQAVKGLGLTLISVSQLVVFAAEPLMLRPIMNSEKLYLFKR